MALTLADLDLRAQWKLTKRIFGNDQEQQQIPLFILFLIFCVTSSNVFAPEDNLPWFSLVFCRKLDFYLSFVLQSSLESHNHFLYALLKPLYAKWAEFCHIAIEAGAPQFYLYVSWFPYLS